MSDTKTCKVILLPLGKLTEDISLEVAQPVKRETERGRVGERESLFLILSLFSYSIRVQIELPLKEVNCRTVS